MSYMIINKKRLSLYINECKKLATDNGLTLKNIDEINNEYKLIVDISKTIKPSIRLIVQPVESLKNETKSDDMLKTDIERIRISKYIWTTNGKSINLETPQYKRGKISPYMRVSIYCCCGCSCININNYAIHLNNKTHTEYITYHNKFMSEIDKYIMVFQN